MGNKYKIESDYFDYNSTYYLPNEHKWCFLADSDNEKAYFKQKVKNAEPRFTKVQADENHPEITGQWETLH